MTTGGFDQHYYTNQRTYPQVQQAVQPQARTLTFVYMCKKCGTTCVSHPTWDELTDPKKAFVHECAACDRDEQTERLDRLEAVLEAR